MVGPVLQAGLAVPCSESFCITDYIGAIDSAGPIRLLTRRSAQGGAPYLLNR